MPFKVDEERMKTTLPVMRNGVEVQPLLQMDPLKPPVISIPHMEYPRVVYMHPNEPFRTVEHKNANFEVVGTEIVQTEHLSKKVENEDELKAALKEGWVKEPYIPKAPPDPNANLYGKRKATEELSPEKHRGSTIAGR
jgi:hypothetical protein